MKAKWKFVLGGIVALLGGCGGGNAPGAAAPATPAQRTYAAPPKEDAESTPAAHELLPLAHIPKGRIEDICVGSETIVFTQDVEDGKNAVLSVPLGGGPLARIADGRVHFDGQLAVVGDTVLWKEVRYDSQERGIVELFSAPLRGGGGATWRSAAVSLLFGADAQRVYFGDGGRLLALEQQGTAREIAKDKGAADIERGLMLTPAEDRLFFYVVSSDLKAFHTESNKRAKARIVSVAKAGGELKDEVVLPQGTSVVGMAADQRSLFWVEKMGHDAPLRLMSRGLAGGVPREVARLGPEVSFDHMQARDGELVWQNLGIGDGRSSILRLTDGDSDVVFDDSLAFAVAPRGIVVARSTGDYGKGAELLLLPR